MTNKEKYIAVFGHEPDVSACINIDMECPDCPFNAKSSRKCASYWWNMTYMEPKENR